MSELVKYNEQTFENIKHVNEYGEEYWLARELQPILEYVQWRNFAEAIERAKLACKNSGYEIGDHFADVSKTISMPKGAHKDIPDYMLSRYACYLIVMNGDPRKEVIAVGQTYFAVKTRQQELIDNYEQLSEDQKRLAIRNEMIAHNKSLAEAAQMAGVVDPRDYAIFQNRGYQGLYGGLGAKEIHARKGLKKARRFWITWAAQSWQPTSSVRRRPTKNSAGRKFMVSRLPMTHITRSAKRSAKPLKSWAARCRRICPRLRKVSRRLNVSKRSASSNLMTENDLPLTDRGLSL